MARAYQPKRTIGRSLNEHARSPDVEPVAVIDDTPFGFIVLVSPEAVAKLGAEPAGKMESVLGATLRIARREDGGLTLSNHRPAHGFDTVEEVFLALSDVLASLGVEPGVFFRVHVDRGGEVEALDARLVPPTPSGAQVRFLDEHEEFGHDGTVIVTDASRRPS